MAAKRQWPKASRACTLFAKFLRAPGILRQVGRRRRRGRGLFSALEGSPLVQVAPRSHGDLHDRKGRIQDFLRPPDSGPARGLPPLLRPCWTWAPRPPAAGSGRPPNISKERREARRGSALLRPARFDGAAPVLHLPRGHCCTAALLLCFAFHQSSPRHEVDTRHDEPLRQKSTRHARVGLSIAKRRARTWPSRQGWHSWISLTSRKAPARLAQRLPLRQLTTRHHLSQGKERCCPADALPHVPKISSPAALSS